MADKYTRDPAKVVLGTRLISELDADSDIQAVPTTVKKVEIKSINEIVIEFNDDIGDASAAETAMDAIITAHDGTALSNGEISPAQITADTVLFNPDKFREARVIRLSSDADGHKISSLPEGTEGEEKMFVMTGLKNIKFVHQDALASANNRIACPGSGDFTLDHDSVAVLRYFTTDMRWRIIYTS